MNIWLVMLLGGLITFALRFSFIYLFGRLHIPAVLRKALHYVPPAVFSALVFPELFLQDGALYLSLNNIRLIAGLVAVVVAGYSRNTLVTILAGLAVLFLLQWIL
ncbi:MAG TPA: AzlD domain-containing protein [Anaerolineales bacterium]|nr:AzlD domain-containing protein [Anaerolineales bacterium]